MLLNCGVGEDSWESLGLQGVNPKSNPNQSILMEINPRYSLEELMLKLKLKYFGPLMGRTDSFVKTLMLGKIEGRRRRGWQRMRWLDGISQQWTGVEQTLQVNEGQGSLVCCSRWGRKESDTTEKLNWYWYWLLLRM